jgi:hypothetical protein
MGTDAAIDIATRVTGATTDLASRMTGAIRDAARQTGAGFEYLLNTAIRESNLNPNAKAKTSSATGLFQFIDQTWLGTMKQSGASLGYGKFADAITRTADGKFTVNDPQMKAEIFALRKDATANAKMAGAFANSNAKFLKERLGRNPSDGELYIAHFLGASGAARFITAAESNPNAAAANYFPRAAAANGSIFYNRQGGAKSLKQVYAGLISKHDVIGTSRFANAKPTGTATGVQQASAVTPSRAAKAANAVQQPSAVAATKAVAETATAAVQKLAALPLSFFRDVPVKAVDPTPVAAPATVTPASRVADAFAAAGINSKPEVATTQAVAPAAPVAAVAPAATPTASVPGVMAFGREPVAQSKTYPMFQTLFQSDERGAVAPVVRELWGPRGFASGDAPDTAAPAADVSTPSAVSPKGPLDLGRFMRPSRRTG